MGMGRPGPPRRLIILVVTALAGAPAALARAEGKRVDGVVNLNTAAPEQLALLPGVGPSKARAIAVYRARRPFRTVDELVRVKGIGRRMVRELRKHLAVAGPTTVRAIAGPVALPPLPPPAPLRPPPAPPRLAIAAVVRPGVIRPALSSRARADRPPRSAANACLPPP